MTRPKMMRAAVAQFHVGTNIDDNLATCLRMLDAAAKSQPHIIVLPEFCNHLSWYDDYDHCRRVSVDADGPFLKAISKKAGDIRAYVAINVTLNRSPGITTGTSFLFGPDGTCLEQTDKQVLIGYENDILTKASGHGALIATPFGLIGLYACMDGVIPETPRGLAVRGAHILLNSLNSFARDEASLHVPVRAAENKVFVLAANKVGLLVPEDKIDTISQTTGIPVDYLHGAGESQIVAPDGTVLAQAPLRGEAVVFAEFDPFMADDKLRPDGTHIFKARRPSLYHPIASDPTTQTSQKQSGPHQVKAALVHGETVDQAYVLVRQAFETGSKLLALAPLSGVSVAELVALCPTDCYVALREEGGDTLLVTATGIVLRQKPIHATKRFGPACSDGLEILQTPLGRIALIAGDDGIFPETFRLLAISGADIVIAPVAPLEGWELATGLIARAAENRLNLLAPARGPQMGFAASLQTDFTLMTKWQTRSFDGLLSQPIVTRALLPLTYVTLYPAAAANKLVSHTTDLVGGRPWALAGAIADQ